MDDATVAVGLDDIEGVEEENRESDFDFVHSSDVDNVPSTPNKDPAKWIVDDSTRDYFALHGMEQNIPQKFDNTRREYSDQSGCLSKSMFVRDMLNGEKASRTWLIFSESTGRVYCGPCRLFDGQTDSQLSSEGYDD